MLNNIHNVNVVSKKFNLAHQTDLKWICNLNNFIKIFAYSVSITEKIECCVWWLTVELDFMDSENMDSVISSKHVI